MALAALPVLVAVVAWGWWNGYTAVRAARRELVQLERRKAALEKANHELRREIDALRRERAARERAARESLDVAGRDETVVIVPPTPTPRPAGTPPAGDDGVSF